MERNTVLSNAFNELRKFLLHTDADEAWKNDQREKNEHAEKSAHEIITARQNSWKDPKFNLN